MELKKNEKKDVWFNSDTLSLLQCRATFYQVRATDTINNYDIGLTWKISRS